MDCIFSLPFKAFRISWYPFWAFPQHLEVLLTQSTLYFHRSSDLFSLFNVLFYVILNIGRAVFIIMLVFFFWLHHTAGRILVP